MFFKKDSYIRVVKLLRENEKSVKVLADALLQKETMNFAEVKELLKSIPK